MSHTPPDPSGAPPYSALAAGYDLVMEHVDYALWADHILDLLESFAPETTSVLELGCGTGTLALEVQARAREFTGLPGGFRYLGTDAAEPMVRVAREKARFAGRQAGDLRFDVADFTVFAVERGVRRRAPPLRRAELPPRRGQIAALFARVHTPLRPGGVFVLDQSTPANSINNEAFFEDEGGADAFAYVRRSHYDRAARIHTTEFDLTVQGATYTERHVQRAYTRDEIAALPTRPRWRRLAAYDGFSFEPATDETERIHWVLQRPA
jgi:SAM-dependent methyltransferase